MRLRLGQREILSRHMIWESKYQSLQIYLKTFALKSFWKGLRYTGPLTPKNKTDKPAFSKINPQSAVNFFLTLSSHFQVSSQVSVENSLLKAKLISILLFLTSPPFITLLDSLNFLFLASSAFNSVIGLSLNIPGLVPALPTLIQLFKQ